MSEYIVPAVVAERLREEGRKQERERVLAALRDAALLRNAGLVIAVHRSNFAESRAIAIEVLAAVRRAIEEGEG